MNVRSVSSCLYGDKYHDPRNRAVQLLMGTTFYEPPYKLLVTGECRCSLSLDTTASFDEGGLHNMIH